MPALCGACPVSSAARLGEQVGAAEKAFVKSTPSSANRCRRGVGTGAPYGDTNRPVSWVCRYRMFGRAIEATSVSRSLLPAITAAGTSGRWSG